MAYETITNPHPKSPSAKEAPAAAVAPEPGGAEPPAASDDAGQDAAPEAPGDDAGAAELSADEAPELPPGAPRQVRIGVVLVTFAGAEDAPSSARTKSEARALAERLAEDAREAFSNAVKRGDPGSAADIGRMPRGVLDPRTEYAVFTLAKGEVSDVLETPRGYWIAKRID